MPEGQRLFFPVDAGDEIKLLHQMVLKCKAQHRRIQEVARIGENEMKAILPGGSPDNLPVAQMIAHLFLFT
jgi:hypothetical protein